MAKRGRRSAATDYFTPIWHALIEHGRSPHDVGLTIAAMMSWARLLPTGGSKAIGFFDPEEDLTSDRWLGVVSALRELAGPARRWVFDGVEHGAQKSKPGELEHYRRTVAGLWDRATKSADAPRMSEEIFAGLSGQHVEPGLIELLINLVDANPGETVYCGFDLTAPVALRVGRSWNAFAEIASQPLAQLVALLGISRDLSLEVVCSDPILGTGDDSAPRPWLNDDEDRPMVRCFDHSIGLPPFGRRYPVDARDPTPRERTTVPTTYAEVLHVSLLLARGRKRRLIVVPDGFLFRRSQADQFFKERLFASYGLSAIVSLPSRVIGSNSGVRSSLLMLDGTSPDARRRNLVLVDGRTLGSHEWPNDVARLIRDRHQSERAAIIGVDELSANEFNLSPERYVIDPTARAVRNALRARQAIRLDDVAELYRAQAVPGSKGRDDDLLVKEIALSDIQAGSVRMPSKPVIISKEDWAKVRRAVVRPGDILISTKGRVGVVGIVPNTAPSASNAPSVVDAIGMEHDTASPSNVVAPWIASQTFVIARLRRSSPINDPSVLAYYLASPFGQAQLQALSGGTSVPMIKMAELRRLSVLVPTPTEAAEMMRQQAQVAGIRESIRLLESNLRSLEKNLWPVSLLQESHTEDRR